MALSRLFAASLGRGALALRLREDVRMNVVAHFEQFELEPGA